MENKAFFEQILISNVHSLAACFYDWPSESLFVCLMKHIEGYVPELNCVCVFAPRTRQRPRVLASVSFACICYMGAWPHCFFGGGGGLDVHWRESEAVAGG